MSQLAKSKADEIDKKLAKLPQDPITVPKRSMDLDPIPSQHCKGLDSRGMLEQIILELLKNDPVDAVGICGMGGIGKTTLAKDIRNKGAKDMFDAILIVEISQVANIDRIQDHIAASVDLSLDARHSLEQSATKLYNALKQVKPKGNNKDQPTKFLIIMDNIWKELKLDEVGIPHERTPQFWSKILFTSRERSVCKLMGVRDKNIVDVSMLGEHESRSLFWEQFDYTVWRCKKLKYIWMESVAQKEENRSELRCLKVLKLSYLDNLIQALGNDMSIVVLRALASTNSSLFLIPSIKNLKTKALHRTQLISNSKTHKTHMRYRCHIIHISKIIYLN